jgi:hypothetical protein
MNSRQMNPSQSAKLPHLLGSIPSFLKLITNPITNKRIDPMITRTKTPQLHPLPIFNLLGITVPPLHRHLTVRIRIHQHVKRAIAFELWEECYRRSDLPENGLYLGLDFCLGFFCGRSCVAVISLLEDLAQGRKTERRNWGRTLAQHSPYLSLSSTIFCSTIY